VISDLHLGLEGTVTSEGGYVPQFQLDELLDDLEEARELTSASRVLVNGDLKHEFSSSRYTEQKELEEFMQFLDERFQETIVVRGNHDTFIEEAVEKHGSLQDFHLEEGVLFIHGHQDLEEVEAGDYGTVVIGHEHPALVLEDEIGVKEKVDAFLYGETEEGKDIVVLPAFSKISGGSKVNQVPSGELLSPVLRNHVDVQSLRAVAVSREAGLFEFPEIGRF
ncbi:MAG: metallophosphoesterase, partial [Candidatus Nanohaloarchaea archaeon]